MDRKMQINSSVSPQKGNTGKKTLKIVGKCFAVLLTTVVLIAATLFISLKMICSDISPAAQRMFVTTILETGQLKFLASWFLSPDEIQAIVDTNSMESFDEEVDDSLISVGIFGSVDIGGIERPDEKDIEVV